MTLKQLKQLPSVSEVIFEIDKNILLNNKYITFIIKLRLEEYRRDAKRGTLNLERGEIIKNILKTVTYSRPAAV